jgi:hypothetical protein
MTKAGHIRVKGHLTFDRNGGAAGKPIHYCEHYVDIEEWEPVEVEEEEPVAVGA